MIREITDFEKLWLKKAIKSLPISKEFSKTELITQLNDLEIVWQCECGNEGCHTVKFQHYEKKKNRFLADSFTNDGRNIFVFVNKDTLKISMLEII